MRTIDIAPTETDRLTARKIQGRLSKKMTDPHLHVKIDGEELAFSGSLKDAVIRMIGLVEAGRSFTLIEAEEVIPQDAATILNVSRPYLSTLLEKGEIPSRLVGDTERRIPLAALLEYKERTHTKSMILLAQLTEDAQLSGLDYQADE